MSGAATARARPAFVPVQPVRRPRRAAALRIVPDVALRVARAADVAAIHALLSGYAAQGLLLPRTEAQVRADLRDYVVAIDGGRVVGCAALRVYDEGLAEVCALAVADTHQGTGLGRRLVERLVARAERRGIARVLALTLQDGFFQRLGFETAPIGQFPQKFARDCVSCARRMSCIEIPVVLETAVSHHAPGRI